MAEKIKKLGKYELLEELGHGGFGTVYRAHDLTLDMERAIKVLHPAMGAAPEFIERFRREARIAARLDHPNIVPVYEFSEDQGYYYLVMKYLPNGSLKDLLSKGPLPYSRALEIMKQVASALEYAFAQPEKLIHRDIKPGNILFDANPIPGKNETARLADFGFAKALGGGGVSSVSGSMVGTPSYMAPEVWRHKAFTPATDIYSLACMFYEMITGKVLFDGDSPADIMTIHVLDGPQFKAGWPEGIPAGIQEVLGKALAKDPQERYQSMREFVAALEGLGSEKVHQVAEEKSVQATPAPVRAEAAAVAPQVVDTLRGTDRIKETPGVAEPERLDQPGSATVVSNTPSSTPAGKGWDSEKIRKLRPFILLGVGILVLLAILLLSSMSNKVTIEPTKTPLATIFISDTPANTLTPEPTLTPVPTLSPSVPVPVVQARVDSVNGSSASVKVGDNLDSGAEISTNTSGVHIVVGDQKITPGVMYWFDGGSTGTVIYDADMMKPVLKSGAIYVRPGSGSAEIHFSQPNIVASVTDGQIIVQLKDNEILVYCFEGTCLLKAGLVNRNIPNGSFISYNTMIDQWKPASGQTNMTSTDEKIWNVRCNSCMVYFATPTISAKSSPTENSYTAAPTATKKRRPKDNNGTPSR